MWFSPSDYLLEPQLLKLLNFILYLLRTALGEAYNGELAFADSLEIFGGGQDDPVSVSIGG